MSDYTNTFSGSAKDTAHSTILGSELDTEFNAVSNMSASKANKVTGPVANRIMLATAAGDLAMSSLLISEIPELAAANAFTGANTFSALNTFTGGITASAGTVSLGTTTNLTGTTTQSGSYYLTGAAYFSNVPTFQRDTAGGAKYFATFKNASAVTKWSIYLSADSAGPDFYLLNASGQSKLQLGQDAKELKTTSTDITYNGTSIVNPVVLTSSEVYFSTNAQTFTWTHNQGSLPDVLMVYMTCYTTDQTYSPGDVVCLSCSMVSESDSGSGPQGHGYTVWAESTTDNSIKLSMANTLYIQKKGASSGALQYVAETSYWKVWFKGIWF